MYDMVDETKKAVLGDVLMDELKAIHECVEDVPAINSKLHQVKATTDEINSRLAVIESVVKDHERDIKGLKQRAA